MVSEGKEDGVGKEAEDAQGPLPEGLYLVVIDDHGHDLEGFTNKEDFFARYAKLQKEQPPPALYAFQGDVLSVDTTIELTMIASCGNKATPDLSVKIPG